ncbi:MAG: aldo/keto reductase, partial [Thermoplasmata archaeon]|nr:aldo/keto reductase [Thermoplasmata archaeon]
FHDDFKAFKKIVDGYRGWSFCQIQYNYMDTENQAGTKGLKYAASKGLGVIVMEPLLGGRLANPPDAIRSMIKANDRGLAPYDLALQWIWNQPEVSLILSGMTTMSQVRGNLRSADRSGVGTLGRGKEKLVQRVRERYKGMIPIPCTKCNYCMPCPHGVNIPGNFEEYNDAFIHDDLRYARMLYARFWDKKSRADACKQCRACEKKCPQKIPISTLMPKVHKVLGEEKPFPRKL